jgi:hypothetical protein
VPKELRTSFVSMMSRHGVPVEEIARLLGHSSSRTTKVIYRRELALGRVDKILQECADPQIIHTAVCDTLVCMAQVDRFSVTMPPELGEGVRQAAARQGTSVSTWLTEAAADKLRNEILGVALDQWEAEDGSFTQDELDEAAARLGLAPRSDVA